MEEDGERTQGFCNIKINIIWPFYAEESNVLWGFVPIFEVEQYVNILVLIFHPSYSYILWVKNLIRAERFSKLL